MREFADDFRDLHNDPDDSSDDDDSNGGCHRGHRRQAPRVSTSRVGTSRAAAWAPGSYARSSRRTVSGSNPVRGGRRSEGRSRADVGAARGGDGRGRGGRQGQGRPHAPTGGVRHEGVREAVCFVTYFRNLLLSSLAPSTSPHIERRSIPGSQRVRLASSGPFSVCPPGPPGPPARAAAAAG